MNIGHREYAPSPNPTSFDAFALEYTKVRDELPEKVRKPLDVFREEVMEICKAHGVDHPSKLVTPEAKATTKTLERVQELLEQIHYIFEHKEVPLGHKDWEVKIPKKHHHIKVVEKDGKAFVIMSGKNSSYIFDSSKASLDQISGVVEDGGLTIVGQEVAFVLHEEERVRVFFKGKMVGDPLECSGIKHLSDMNGKVTYVVETIDEEDKIYVDGEIYGSPEGWYREINNLLSLGNQLAFVAKKNESNLFNVFIGEDRVGDSRGYQWISLLTEVDGKLAFVGQRWNIFYLVYDGKLIAESLERISCVQKINGELSWIETSEREGVATLWSEGEVSEEYYAIYTVVDTGAEPLLVVKKKKGDRWTLMQGEKVLGKKEGYDDSGLGYILWVGGQVIFSGGEVEEKISSTSGVDFGSYDQIYKMKVVDDKHFIVIAEEDGRVVQRTFDVDHPPYQGKLPN